MKPPSESKARMMSAKMDRAIEELRMLLGCIEEGWPLRGTFSIEAEISIAILSVVELLESDAEDRMVFAKK